MNAPNPSGLPRGVAWLAASGILPFAGAVILALARPIQRDLALAIFIGYGAVILSFIGGTRWGRGLGAGMHFGRFVESVVPSLLGFAALLLIHIRPGPALLLLAAGFAIWLLIDLRDRHWSPSYRRMRGWISATVLVLHAAWIPLLLAH